MDYHHRLVYCQIKSLERGDFNLQTMVQSNESESVPSPSLAIDPPKRLVTSKLCRIVKQNIETPARSGTSTVSKLSSV
jgi:hypothetical protein